MYRLVLKLPFDVVLLYREPFETLEAAEAMRRLLIQGFEIVEDTDSAITTGNVFVVPIKERDEDRRDQAVSES